MNFKFVLPNKKDDLKVRYLVTIYGVCENKAFSNLSNAVDFVNSLTKKDFQRDTIKKSILIKDVFIDGWYGTPDYIRINIQYNGTCDKCGIKKPLIRIISSRECSEYFCKECNEKRNYISAFNHNYESLFMNEGEDL